MPHKNLLGGFTSYDAVIRRNGFLLALQVSGPVERPKAAPSRPQVPRQSSSYRRGSKRQDREDLRRIRRPRQRKPTPKAMNLSPTRRRPRAEAPASWRGTWDTRLFACRRRGPRTGDDNLCRCIRRWAWATPDQPLLESICGDFANSACFGPNRVDGARAFPRAALAERRTRPDHCQLSLATQNSFAGGGGAPGRGCSWD